MVVTRLLLHPNPPRARGAVHLPTPPTFQAPSPLLAVLLRPLSDSPPPATGTLHVLFALSNGNVFLPLLVYCAFLRPFDFS